MDPTDIRLSQLLLQDSRTPYRDLADKLNITVQAVHRRIQLMQETRVISNLHASISLGYLNAVNTVMVGCSAAKSMDEAAKALSTSDSIHRVLWAASNHHLVESFIRDLSELESHMEFVRKAAEMPIDLMGIVGTAQFGTTPLNQRPEEKFELTPLDYGIIASLQTDSRKAVADIAEELKVSAKTVKRRLERMVEEKAIEFGMTYHPGYAGGFAAAVIMNLRPGLDKSALKRELLGHFGPKLIYITTFSNLPEVIIAVIYCGNMMECNEIVEGGSCIDGVEKHASHIIQFGHEFETWRDKMPRERAMAKKT
jgi:DNA-binding Lrp family transcriptional regulator